MTTAMAPLNRRRGGPRYGYDATIEGGDFYTVEEAAKVLKPKSSPNV
jgi:hypothetical protein